MYVVLHNDCHNFTLLVCQHCADNEAERAFLSLCEIRRISVESSNGRLDCDDRSQSKTLFYARVKEINNICIVRDSFLVYFMFSSYIRFGIAWIATLSKDWRR